MLKESHLGQYGHQKLRLWKVKILLDHITPFHILKGSRIALHDQACCFSYWSLKDMAHHQAVLSLEPSDYTVLLTWSRGHLKPDLLRPTLTYRITYLQLWQKGIH